MEEANHFLLRSSTILHCSKTNHMLMVNGSRVNPGKDLRLLVCHTISPSPFLFFLPSPIPPLPSPEETNAPHKQTQEHPTPGPAPPTTTHQTSTTPFKAPTQHSKATRKPTRETERDGC